MNYDQSAIAAILGFAAVISSLALVVAIIAIIGLWKMFKKAGEEGWKAIIPIYNVYILTKISGVSPWWILVTFIAGFISGLVPALGIISSAVSIYFSVILCVSIAKSFGKDEAFAVGLFFLGPIFYLILGFGSAEYQGKKPMKDPIMEFVDTNIFHKEASSTGTTTNTSSSSKADRFCTNCGAKLDGDSNFCTSCGTKSE